MYEEPAVKSPCVSVCVLDDMNVCVACYRTMMEITDWVMYTDEQKLEVLQKCKQREQAT